MTSSASVATDGQMLRLSTRRGTRVTVKCHANPRTSKGSIFLPFHYREAAANLLTHDDLDPYGKIPSFKFCALKVELAE